MSLTDKLFLTFWFGNFVSMSWFGVFLMAGGFFKASREQATKFMLMGYGMLAGASGTLFVFVILPLVKYVGVGL